ncbi:MAG: hypothetical protein ACI8R4_004340 [Paracoccaceae bacterium]|jgi:hypothetical protein
MGISGVAVNGKINGATKSATDALAKKHASVAGSRPCRACQSVVRSVGVAKLPSLNRRYAATCPPAARLIYLVPGGPGSLQTEMQRKSFLDVEQFFHTFYGLYPASRADVADASSGYELAEYAIELQRKRGRFFGRTKTAEMLAS